MRGCQCVARILTEPLLYAMDPTSLFKSIGEHAASADAGASAPPAPAPSDEITGGDAPEEGAPTQRAPLTCNAGEMMSMRSLCVACEDQGVTNLLLTRVPFFRDIIVVAFQCEECGYRNSEVQSAEVQERGCQFTLRVSSAAVRGGQRRGVGRWARAGLSGRICVVEEALVAEATRRERHSSLPTPLPCRT